MNKILLSLFVMTSFAFSVNAQEKKTKQDSITEAQKKIAIADSIQAYESTYERKFFYGIYKYKNTNSFTGYLVYVKAPQNTYSDFSFTLAVENPEGSYSIEGFAIQKEETLDFYYTKTIKGKFPLSTTVNKKAPLFSFKKINDNMITIWGQIKEDENIKILFQH